MLLTQNLYHLLGNDVEDDSTPILATKEVVKNTTSSKKADVPPPSADPAKAKKKSKATGNEAALKNKANNKEVSAPSSTPSKHYKKPFDRHSRSGKSDSGKKIKQSWGQKSAADLEVEAEAEGAADAVAGLEEDAESAEPVDNTPKKSLADYIAELELKQKELDGAKKVRQANQGAESKWTSAEKIEKAEQGYVEPSVVKKAKAKAPKEKKFLEIDAKFADSEPAPRGDFGGRGRGGRDGNRGGNRGRGAPRGRGGNRGGAREGAGSAKPTVDDKHFPSL